MNTISWRRGIIGALILLACGIAFVVHAAPPELQPAPPMVDPPPKAKGVTCPAGQLPRPDGKGCANEPFGGTTSCVAGLIANGSGACVIPKSTTCPAGQLPRPGGKGCANEPFGGTTSCAAGLIANGSGACVIPKPN